LNGLLLRKAGPLAQVSGATSLDRFSNAVMMAAMQPDIASILIACDSGGGDAGAAMDTYTAVAAATKQKPVETMISGLCCSAAYYIASASTSITATRGSTVGAIGVYGVHEATAGFPGSLSEKLGVLPTVISAGPRKVEFGPWAPLSEEARGRMQADVSRVYARFLADVARGRGRTMAEVEQQFGQGGTLPADRALAAGMLDTLDTMPDVLRRVMRAKPGTTPRAIRAEIGTDLRTSRSAAEDFRRRRHAARLRALEVL
jgi:capsid assembly protease